MSDERKILTVTAKYGYMIISGVTILSGILLTAFPEKSISGIIKFLGILMAAFGVIKITGYYSKDLFRLNFQYDLELGIAFLVTGVVIFLKTGEATEFFTAAVGISIILESLFRMRTSLEARDFGIRSWKITFALAVISAAAGCLFIAKPSETAGLMASALGILLIFEGTLNLVSAVSLVKIISGTRSMRL